MPPKRRRTSESLPAKDEGFQESSAQPHKDIWHSDGSIVLATDVHLYRVHKSLLSKHSKILKDLLEIPTADANTEFWEDVPIVRMAGDKDDEVSVLLEALYDRNFRDTLRGYQIAALSSLLSISTKYDFDGIRADVLRTLKSFFPNEFKNLGISKRLWSNLFSKGLFELLVVAHRCEAQSILPTVYYLCATFPINSILERLHILPEECMKNILRGRDVLCCMSQGLSVRTMQAMRGDGLFSKTCRTVPSHCLEKLRAKIDGKYALDRFIFILDQPERGVLEGLSVEQSGVCNLCASAYAKGLNDLKKQVWDNLPVFFMRKKWEELCDK
ncbi:hypothetical protein SCHPADRAFT_1001830 [Schizopora paradoxa]|uniref:BTB domain-containing protein n=1 Tax=Schizopora paradoxa TaxID=27342 RepID=A0A0H2RQX3_9AGAM|nr:hypothetical protein SCHPADRAFT_1001830 [Schizopora paradoxa]